VEGKVTFLLTTICNGTQAEEMRAMAAVLLRRLFSSEFMDFYPKVTIKISYCLILTNNVKIMLKYILRAMEYVLHDNLELF